MTDGHPPSGTPSPIESSLCQDDTSAIGKHEACNQRVDDYWTDERRRNARPLEATAPKAEEPSKTSDLTRSSRGSTAESISPPLLSAPKPNDQG